MVKLNNFWNNWPNQTKLAPCFHDISIFNINSFSKILKIELSRDQVLMRQNRKKSNFWASTALSIRFKNGFFVLFFLYYLSLGCNHQTRFFSYKANFWGKLRQISVICPDFGFCDMITIIIAFISNQENVQYPTTVKIHGQQKLKQQYMTIHKSLSNEQKF